MLHRDIESLLPEMQPKVNEFLKLLEANNIKYRIMETYREQSTQNAYYAQGRKPLEEVNKLREIASLKPINEEDNKNIITKVTYSKHTDRKAIDIAPVDEAGNPNWNADEWIWNRMASLGEDVGLTAGYRWADFKDPPHFEIS